MEKIFEYCFTFIIQNFDYRMVFVLIILESTLIPIIIPIELLILIGTGYMIKNDDLSQFTMIPIFILGIVIGSTINYLTGKYLGRPFILKYGKYFFIKESRFLRYEEIFLKYSTKILFIGRFIPIPGIKHIITLPAGITRMGSITLIPTILGAIILTTIFILIGYYLGISIGRGLFKNLKDISIATSVIFMIILIFKDKIKKLIKKYS